MALRALLIIVALCGACFSIAQKPAKEQPPIDTSFTDYDLLFSELDAFLDSITAPRTFFLFNTGITTGIFNEIKGEFELNAVKKTVVNPSVAYFHKSGLGVMAESSMIAEGQQLNPYQFSFTGSYDYLRNRRFSSGISYTHFITRKDLAFYTSPLQNQLFAYFTYRKLWVKPSVALSYGWGNRSNYRDREEKIIAIQLAQRGFTRIKTTETISDFSLTTSLRHDFYWLKIFGQHDFFRFTPQVSFSSGTQQFGFNQTSNTYATITRTGTRILYNTENISLDNNLYFQPLSLTGFLKAEYSVRKFFVQPQVVFDYYFPAEKNNFLAAWLVNVGMMF